MTCDVARDQMLNADLSELTGDRDTALARHLDICHGCRAMAQAIVETEGAIAAALDAAAVRSAANRGRPGPRMLRSYWFAALPVAAAAGLAVLFCSGDQPLSPVASAVSPVREASTFVETTRQENVLVFNTSDPDIVVVWFFGGTD